MKIAITGASGFVGQAVSAHLRRAGHEVFSISIRGAISPTQFAGCEAVIHLAGEPVAQRWTAAARERIRSSRVDGTRKLVEALEQAAKNGRPPQAMVSASAVGYYGSRGDDVLLESEPADKGFLGQVAEAWEQEAMGAEVLGTRVTRVRFGVVLGRTSEGKPGGALQKMLLPFKLGLGGKLGSGDQWISWIHLRDLVRMIEFLILESTVRGVFNGVAPNAVTNREFTRALAEAVHRPAIIPVPAFALKLAVGEMSEILLGSQRAVPDAALRAGFTFEYNDVFGALAEIVQAK
ncbi:MAG: TIGR01777 family oxidoreductase [Acidobacteriota bacterium]